MQLRLGGRALVPSSPRDTKHKSPWLPDTIVLVFFSISAKTLLLLPSPWNFFLLETHHILKKKKKPIVSKTCLLSARSVYRAPVSSQPSLQTEKPETPREVIFQSTKTGPLEIAVDAKMSHYSPKERITLEALAPRTHIGWSSDGGWTNPSTPPAPPSPPAFGERPPPLLTIGNRGR